MKSGLAWFCIINSMYYIIKKIPICIVYEYVQFVFKN